LLIDSFDKVFGRGVAFGCAYWAVVESHLAVRWWVGRLVG
jgi:hypothetical protein